MHPIVQHPSSASATGGRRLTDWLSQVQHHWQPAAGVFFLLKSSLTFLLNSSLTLFRFTFRRFSLGAEFEQNLLPKDNANNVSWGQRYLILTTITIQMMISLCMHVCAHSHICILITHAGCGAWWLSGRFGALRPDGRRFESHSSHHVGTLGKSFTYSCM